jgi:hypothetical protein
MSTKNILYEIDSFALGNYTYLTDMSFPTSYTYRWFKNGPNCLVMKAELDEFNNVTSASYFTSSGLVSSQNKNSFALQVHPNPVNRGNQLLVKFNNEIAGSVFIYDVSGRLIEEKQIKSSSLQIILSTEKYESGTYFMKVLGKDKMLGVSKFVVTQ